MYRYIYMYTYVYTYIYIYDTYMHTQDSHPTVTSKGAALQKRVTLVSIFMINEHTRHNYSSMTHIYACMSRRDTDRAQAEVPHSGMYVVCVHIVYARVSRTAR